MPEIRTKQGAFVKQVTVDECAAYESEAALLNAHNLSTEHNRVSRDRPVRLVRESGSVVDTFDTEAEALAHKRLREAELLGSTETPAGARLSVELDDPGDAVAALTEPPSAAEDTDVFEDPGDPPPDSP